MNNEIAAASDGRNGMQEAFQVRTACRLQSEGIREILRDYSYGFGERQIQTFQGLIRAGRHADRRTKITCIDRQFNQRSRNDVLFNDA